MKLRRMLALTLVLMTLMTAALAADDPGLYYIGDEATPENLTGHTQVYNAVDAAPECYQVHVWDNNEATDAQMPFEIRVEWGK